jgi:hypothetical protein
MLFQEAAQAKIEDRWRRVTEAYNPKSNHWHESWSIRLDSLTTCYQAAKVAQSPQAWRAVVVEGRAARETLEATDGCEHRIYVLITQFTDAADAALDQAGRDPRHLIGREELEEVVSSLDRLREEMHRERNELSTELRRTIDEGLDRVGKAKRAVIHMGDVKPNITIFSTGLGETLDLIKRAVEYIAQGQLLNKIKQLAGQVREATARWIRQIKERFSALKLAWKQMAEEVFFEGAPATVNIRVRVKSADQQVQRIPGAGLPFRDVVEHSRGIFEGPEMVVVPAGQFTMGSPRGAGNKDECPEHSVELSKAFAIGIAPVARGEFARFVDLPGYKPQDGAIVFDGKEWITDHAKSWRDPGFHQDDSHPVVCVS